MIHEHSPEVLALLEDNTAGDLAEQVIELREQLRVSEIARNGNEDIRTKLEAAERDGRRWRAAFDALSSEHNELKSRVQLTESKLSVTQTREARLRAAAASFAKIEVPTNAEPGTWVATTLHCNDQVTAHSVL